MYARGWAAVGVACSSALALAWALGAPTGDRPDAHKARPPASLFGLNTVHQFHLEVSAQDWEKLQPTGGMRFPGGPGGPPGGPPAAAPAAGAGDVHRGGGFGLAFPWVHANLQEGEHSFKNIGIRFKGNASYMASSRGLRRNLKLDFNHFVEGQNVRGEKSLNLNAGAMDPTRAREALAYAVFRAAGVPAPRTAFAEVTLTIPGKYDREYLGLYTLVQQVGKPFLKEHFQNARGLLLKPEGVRGLEYFGEDWAQYTRRYNVKSDADAKQRQRLIDLARLVHRAEDADFRRDIESYLDVDEFLRFVAVNAFVANLDSAFMMGHNYYIYLNPRTNKFVFIPWDLDLSLAGFPMAGGADQQADLSLTHPYGGDNRLVDRLLAIREISSRYQAILKELAATCFAKERLLKDLDAIEQTVKEPLARERKAAEKRQEGGGFGFGPPPGGPGGGGFGPPGGGFGRLDLRPFIEKRVESVAAQVAGKSKGYVPAMGFGPGMMGMFPRPGEIIPAPLQDALRLSAEQKKQLAALQKESEIRLDRILTDPQRKQLKEFRERGPGGPPGFGPPGPGPGRPGPGG